jgi:Raf kinase inhibitor-like YbhB/YbcL family protein
MVAACGSDTPAAGTAGGQAMSMAGTGTAMAGTAAPAGMSGTGAAGQTSATAGTAASAAGRMSTPPATAGAGGMPGASGTGAAGAAAGSGGMAMAAAGSSAAGQGAAGGAAGAAGGMPGGGMLGGPLMWTGAFTMGTTIAPRHKCPMDVIGGGKGENKSPPLTWKGGPADTKSFAVVLYDTQYKALHWVLWDIPPTVSELPEGLAAGYELTNPMGAHQAAGNMGTDKHAYFGPCSSGSLAGTYEYRLYALNTAKLSLTEMSTGAQAQMAVEAAKVESVVWSGKPGM